ncbi:MAG TPA: AraC family transcriptional regulator [Anaeromyxobacteraceae bacterium]|jgi:AraC family transcriptional regulator
MRSGSSCPEPLSVPVLALASHDTWRGIRVEEAHFPTAGERPEGTLAGHVLVVASRAPFRVEARWPGELPAAERVLHPGQFNFFPAATAYAVRWLDPAATIMVEMAPETVAAMTGAGDPGDRPRLRPLASQSDGFVAHVALALRDLVRDGHPGGAAYGEALGSALAEHMVRRYSDGTTRPREPRGALPVRLLRRVADHIEANLERDITLHELAREAQMSVYHFARSFKHRTGLAPHQYILQRRIERARSLLTDPVLTVGDVAVRCGFAHHSHFSDTFHRFMGMTPTAYRRAM